MPFEPGVSGNPNGRPKTDKPWRHALRRALSKTDVINGQEIKRLVRIADRCVNEALNGDVTAIKEIGDRLDGKAPQANIHQGDAGKPIEHIVTVNVRKRDYAG